MTVVIDSRNPRSVAAIALAVRAGAWAKARTLDGQKFYGVPSRTRPGLIHLADTQSCTCEDHAKRDVDCAHILAVRLHVAQVSVKRQLTARVPKVSRYAAIFGEEG
jgi:hypothetical protein